MYKGVNKCVVCEKDKVFIIRTKINESYKENYVILEKNNDGTFKCEITIKCEHCRARQRLYRDVDFR